MHLTPSAIPSTVGASYSLPRYQILDAQTECKILTFTWLRTPLNIGVNHFLKRSTIASGSRA